MSVKKPTELRPDKAELEVLRERIVEMIQKKGLDKAAIILTAWLHPQSSSQPSSRSSSSPSPKRKAG